MNSPIDVRIDISASTTLDEQLETAISVYTPNPDRYPNPATVIFAFPGATYRRCYFDLRVAGRQDYSFANHLVTKGNIVVTCDHIGIGDSSPYEPFTALTREIVVQADQATVRSVTKKLADGTLVRALKPIEDPILIGVGHSMGAYIITLQQAEYRAFDALAILGFSELPQIDHPTARDTKYSELRSKMMDPTRPPRKLFRRMFYDNGVPEDIRTVDERLAVRTYPWIWDPSPRGILDDPSSRDAARSIDVPVFLGFGSRDWSPNPHLESSAYPRSTDITTLIIPNSAHCFNYSDARQEFFERFAGWVRSLPRNRRGQTNA